MRKIRRKIIISSVVVLALIGFIIWGYSGDGGSRNTTPSQTTSKTTTEAITTEPEKVYLPFSMTLENYNDKEFFSSPCPDFLNSEQKKIWQEAYFMTYMSVAENSFGLAGEYEKSPRLSDDGHEYHYMRTGVSYDEMYSYITSAFTKEYTEETFMADTYINDDGELLFHDRARKPDVSYRDCEFNLISSNYNKIEFSMTALYSWKDIATLGELDKTETESHLEEHTFTMVRTENGWRMSEYSFWL